MRGDEYGVLGMFPGCVAPGGIQASGRIAWEAIRAAPQSFGPAFQLCYGDTGPVDLRVHAAVHTTTRQGAVSAALRLRQQFRLIVVWHMDLLRLLPFVHMRGARVVLVLQGVEAWRRRGLLERWLLRRVNAFVSISDYTWRRFVRVYPEYARAAHATVPLGIGSRCDEQISEPDPTPTAIMLGRLARGEDYKGHREMLNAWPLVRQKLPGARLLIVGDGDLRPDLERIATDRRLDGSVRFLGFVSDDQKHTLLRRARCLTVPSRGEGFGLIYLEAMRLGRPCLVSTLDAGMEVVDPPRQGLAVNPEDSEALAAATCRLLTAGEEWQQWSAAARCRYEQQYTAEHYQRRLVTRLQAPLESIA